MDIFTEFTKLYQITIVTIASITSIVLLNTLQDRVVGKKFLFIIVIVIVSAGLAITNYFVENLINTSATVRNWIDEDNFIEGYYYDYTIKNEPDDHLSLIKIAYQNNKYAVFGEGFNEEGKHLSTYHSTHSTYQNRVLYFTWVGESDHPMTGMDQMQFGSPPKSYSGFYINYENPSLNSIKGVKVNEEILKKYNNFNSILDKGNFAKNYFKEIKASLPDNTDLQSVPTQ